MNSSEPPPADSEPPSPGSPSPGSPSTGSPSTGSTNAVLARPRILLVEDTPETSDMLKLFLRNIAQVDHAIDAESALAMTSSVGRPYDMLLMDINLGHGRSGIDVTKELRRRDDYAKVPILALTAYAMAGDKENILAAGCTEYLSKPFSKGELVEVMRKYLPNI